MLFRLCLLLLCSSVTISQRTALDDKFLPIYRKVRLLTLKLAGNVDLEGIRRNGVSFVVTGKMIGPGFSC